jgi:predicted AlkP superfamily phosphohydrolase/phosphomutase
MARIDWSTTKAYAVGGGIYLNGDLVGPPGSPGYEAAAGDVMSGLRALRLPSGGTAVTHLHRREEIYSGPHLHRAPNIIFLIQEYGYQLHETVEGDSVWGDTPVASSHRLDGLIIAAGPDFAAVGQMPDKVHIYDVAPTLLHALGESVAEDMDGRVRTQMLSPEAAARPVTKRRSLVSLTRRRLADLRPRALAG